MPSPNLTFHEKLEGPNYLSWLTQFLPILRSTDSMGIIDEFEPCPPKFLSNDSDKPILNPDFVLWQRKDQTILSWINIILSKKVISTIYGLDTSQQVGNPGQPICKSVQISNCKFEEAAIEPSPSPKTCSDYI